MKSFRMMSFTLLLTSFSQLCPVATPQQAAIDGTSAGWKTGKSQQEARKIEDQRYNDVVAGLDKMHRNIYADYSTDRIACGNDYRTNASCLKAAADKRDKRLAQNDQLRAQANAFHANQIEDIYRYWGDIFNSVGGGNPTGTPVDGTPAGGDPGGIPGGTSGGRSNPNGNPGGMSPSAGGTGRNPGGNNGNNNGRPPNSPGGNPGCTITTAKNQSIRWNSRNDYLLAGTYGVYSQAWQGGDTRSGWARISKAGSPGMYKIQTPKGTALMTYCSTVDGNPVFEVSGRKVRFNRLQVPGNELVVYDVWWLSSQNEKTGSPETWKLGQ